jgi:hypothetical protein
MKWISYGLLAAQLDRIDAPIRVAERKQPEKP